MKVEVKTRGFAELDNALANELPKATAKNVLKRAAINAMKVVEDRARELAPKDDGELAASITTKPVKAKRVSRTRYASSSGVAVATGPAPAKKLTKSNADWQEYGTVKMGANPYMRPAIDGHETEVIDRVAEELRAQIDKAKKRSARKLAKGR